MRSMKKDVLSVVEKKLSDRIYKLSDGTIVQRDWYSSYLLYNIDYINKTIDTIREIDYVPCGNTKTIDNVVNGQLDCRVRCSGRKTVFQSLKMMYDYCKMSPVRTSTACCGGESGKYEFVKCDIDVVVYIYG